MKTKIIKAGNLENLETEINDWIENHYCINPKIDISYILEEKVNSAYSKSYTPLYIAVITYKNESPNIQIREGMGNWFVRVPRMGGWSEEVAIPK